VLIDRLVHHATMITLNDKSHRLCERGMKTSELTAGRTFSGNPRVPPQQLVPIFRLACHSVELTWRTRASVCTL